MKYKIHIAALLLSAAFVSVPAFTGVAYAHDMGDAPKTAHAIHHHGHLSQEQMDLIKATLKQERENNKDTYEAIHGLHKQLDAVLSAPTFDKEAYLSIVDQLEAKHEVVQKSRNEAFASIADKFSPQEREHVARLFSHKAGGWHEHKGEGHKEWKHEHKLGEHHVRHHGHDYAGWEHHDGQNFESNNTQASAPNNNINLVPYNSQSDFPPYSHR